MDSGELFEDYDTERQDQAAVDAIIAAWLAGEDVSDADAWNEWEQTYADDTYVKEEDDDGVE